jgi:23S rRNA pseudouridine1911/1915/1917 synthase
MTLEAAAGERLDRVVAAALPALSRRQIQALFAAGRVTVIDGERRRPARRGERSAGVRLEVEVEHASDRALPDPDLPLAIIFESDQWVIVDKPAGIASAPVDAGERGTIANALIARYPEMRDIGHRPREPGLCHRLDTDTSGLLLAARDREAFEGARAALRDGRIDKRYLLVCRGAEGLREQGHIDLALSSRGGRVVVDPAGRAATTIYRVLKRNGGRALIEASAGGAFRHQLRVHFAAIGAPLVGDHLYGGEPWPARHALHASFLRFAGDETLEGFEASSPLPPELAALLEP